MNSAHTIGIIGGGQLARMLYEASIGLDLEIKLLAEGPEVSAARVVHEVTVGDYTDPQVVTDFAAGIDVLTFDHEHVPTSLLTKLEAAGLSVRPGPAALVHAQDKALMRARLAGELGLPAPRWRVCRDAEALRALGEEIGWPLIAKESRGGYDGHGVWKIEGAEQCEEPFAQSLEESAGEKVEIVGEEFVDFARELSVIVARNPHGECVSYPVSETVQEHGICVETTTPAPGLDPARAAQIQRLGRRIAAELGVVGLLAVELMERRDGEVVVNELAMRPHNTGHWSIDGAVTSQFENHLRAVAGLPLGDPSARQPWCTMRNVLGGSRDDLTAELATVGRDGGLKVQFYGKSIRPGRKVGHVTTYGDDLADVQGRARAAAAYLMGLAG
ncbi:5-(carboxyamino)imidazole ribonucleotide synthase [Propionibacterium cyclohexanicum]|uniref:N5-carboxyaminoimidazole ribonucleotide synthase n=1 Tax=Propionibacterium cyclohexanicum TaxID=64702 RepID=A0A1H9QGD0_9ACTN|nr:5-(carboxyamino)imidazole ribonucleotide synthase [Propionibacterium cyclohexanicum]SER58909.1 5-(carboxyamino)imidazole ribonucleotide synthase [Propionibacterium cyclohexanicum]